MSDSASTPDRLVGCILSRLIGAYHSQDADDLDAIRCALRYFESAPAHPAPAEARRSGRAVLRRVLKMSRDDLSRLWEHEAHLSSYPALQDQIIQAFFDERDASVIRQIVALGPAEAAKRAANALHTYSHKEVRPTRARPSGGQVTRRSVDGMLGAYRRLFKVICQVSALNYPGDDLAQWRSPPQVVAPALQHELIDPERDEISRLLRAVRPLSHRARLELHRQLAERLSEHPRPLTVAERRAERQRGALEAMIAVARDAELPEGTAPMTTQFTDYARRLGLPWAVSSVGRAFRSWRNATSVYEEARTPESARVVRQRDCLLAGGREGADFLEALRHCMEEEPDTTRKTDHERWRKSYKEQAVKPERRLSP